MEHFSDIQRIDEWMDGERYINKYIRIHTVIYINLTDWWWQGRTLYWLPRLAAFSTRYHSFCFPSSLPTGDDQSHLVYDTRPAPLFSQLLCKPPLRLGPSQGQATRSARSLKRWMTPKSSNTTKRRIMKKGFKRWKEEVKGEGMRTDGDTMERRGMTDEWKTYVARLWKVKRGWNEWNRSGMNGGNVKSEGGKLI